MEDNATLEKQHVHLSTLSQTFALNNSTLKGILRVILEWGCVLRGFTLMHVYSIQRLLWEKLRLHIRQPEVFPEAVACHGFDAAVFAVGIGIVYCAVDEIVEARQHAQRAGQPVVAVGVRLMVDVPMLPDAVPHISL